jgi:hypothetical protein
MADMIVPGDVRAATIEAVIVRADGTTERLGVISSYHRNPLRRAWARLQRRLRRT